MIRLKIEVGSKYLTLIFKEHACVWRMGSNRHLICKVILYTFHVTERIQN